MTNFEKYLLRYPPIFCRLLAKHPRGKPFTNDEIAQRGKLSPDEVVLIAEQTSWESITIGAMRRFLVGCGIDFGSRACTNRILSYITSDPNWKYLRKSGNWSNYFEPLCKKYKASLQKRT